MVVNPWLVSNPVEGFATQRLLGFLCPGLVADLAHRTEHDLD